MGNYKKIFFVLTLLTLVLLVSTVNATDNTTATADDTPVVTDTSSYTMVSTQEEIQTNPNEKIVKLENKEIKEDKNFKTSTKTVEVSSYDELVSTINTAFNDYENDEYVINLQNGTYTLQSSTNCYGILII